MDEPMEFYEDEVLQDEMDEMDEEIIREERYISLQSVYLYIIEYIRINMLYMAEYLKFSDMLEFMEEYLSS